MLDSGFFTNTIVTLLIGLAFFIAFCYIIKKVEKINFVHNLTLVRKTRILVYFVFGLFIGLSSPIINATQISLNISYGFVSDLAIIIICGLFTSPYIFSGSTIIYLLSSMLFNIANQPKQLLFTYLFIFYLICCTVVSLIRILNIQKFYWFILIIIPLTLFSLIFNFLIVPESLVDTGYVLPWVGILSMILFYLLGTAVVNFLGKTERLSEAIQFNKNHFILSNYSIDYLSDQVTKNKNKQGLFILFTFYGTEKISIIGGRKKYDLILDQLVENIKFKFGTVFKGQISWFISKKNYFGVFVHLDQWNKKLSVIYEGNNLNVRKSDDIFAEFDLIFRSVSTKIRYNDEIYNIQISSSAAIYGVHSCDFNKLMLVSEVLLEQHNEKKESNIIQVYNPIVFNLLENDAKLYTDLIDNFDTSSLQVFLNQYICLNNDGVSYFYANVSVPTQLVFSKAKIINKINDPQNKSTLIRYLAIRGLRAFQLQNNKKLSKIIIDYSIYELGSINFNVANFLSKLNRNITDLNNLIINIPFDLESYKLCNDTAISNIKLLKANNLKFSASGVNVDELSLVKAIGIDYIFANYKFDLKDYSKEEFVNDYVTEMLKFFQDQKIKVLIPK